MTQMLAPLQPPVVTGASVPPDAPGSPQAGADGSGALPPPAPLATSPGDTPARSAWRIEFRGVSLAQHEITGRHATLVSLYTERDSWVDMTPASGPVALMAWIAAAYAIATTSDPIAAMQVVQAAPLAEIASSLTIAS